MTRIFEALRKAQPVRVPGPPVPPAAAPPVPASRAAIRPVPPQASLPSSSSPVIEWIQVRELPAEIAREMTGLRIGIEAAIGDQTTRTVLLMSAQSGEGTSTVAGQFARLLASDTRIRALMMDGHARRPAGTRYLAAESRAAAPAEGLHRLAVMPMPREMIENQIFHPDTARGLIASLEGKFDWVVMDGPPILESAESVELAAVADGVVIVVQAGSTKHPVVARAVELLRKSGAKVLGTVLNRRRLEIPDFIYRRI